jgi:hypothetical protein
MSGKAGKPALDAALKHPRVVRSVFASRAFAVASLGATAASIYHDSKAARADHAEGIRENFGEKFKRSLKQTGALFGGVAIGGVGYVALIKGGQAARPLAKAIGNWRNSVKVAKTARRASDSPVAGLLAHMRGSK